MFCYCLCFCEHLDQDGLGPALVFICYEHDLLDVFIPGLTF